MWKKRLNIRKCLFEGNRNDENGPAHTHIKFDFPCMKTVEWILFGTFFSSFRNSWRVASHSTQVHFMVLYINFNMFSVGFCCCILLIHRLILPKCLSRMRCNIKLSWQTYFFTFSWWNPDWLNFCLQIIFFHLNM